MTSQTATNPSALAQQVETIRRSSDPRRRINMTAIHPGFPFNALVVLVRWFFCILWEDYSWRLSQCYIVFWLDAKESLFPSAFRHPWPEVHVLQHGVAIDGVCGQHLRQYHEVKVQHQGRNVCHCPTQHFLNSKSTFERIIDQDLWVLKFHLCVWDVLEIDGNMTYDIRHLSEWFSDRLERSRMSLTSARSWQQPLWMSLASGGGCQSTGVPNRWADQETGLMWHGEARLWVFQRLQVKPASGFPSFHAPNSIKNVFSKSRMPKSFQILLAMERFHIS